MHDGQTPGAAIGLALCLLGSVGCAAFAVASAPSKHVENDNSEAAALVVKAGDPRTARKLYAQAKLSRDYAAWPYKDVLERRLASADENVATGVSGKKPDSPSEEKPGRFRLRSHSLP